MDLLYVKSADLTSPPTAGIAQDVALVLEACAAYHTEYVQPGAEDAAERVAAAFGYRYERQNRARE